MDRSNRLKNIKVGIAAVVALILLITAYWYVGTVTLAARTYPISVIFRDVAGVDTGAPVMMAGVRIGSVDRVSLTPDGQAKVDLRIRQGVRIPSGGTVRIASVSLLGDYYVEFIPGPLGEPPIPPESLLDGVSAFSMDDLMPQVSSLLTRMDDLGESVQDLLTDQNIFAQLSDVLDRVDSLIGSVQRVVDDREIQDGIRSVVRNLNLASAAVLNLSTQVGSIAEESRDDVRLVAENLVMASENITRASEKVDRILDGVSGEDISEVVKDIKSATAHLDSAAASADEILGDPQMREDLKISIRNARESTEGLKAVMERLGVVVGVGRDPIALPTPTTKPATGTGAKVDVLFDAREMETRVDASYTLPWRGDTFYQFGLYDIGESSKINLQAGRNLREGHSVRAGLYQSRLAAGYDWQIDEKFMLKADFYRPNELRLDLKGRYNVTEELGGWLGFDNIFGNPRPMMGVQFRF